MRLNADVPLYPVGLVVADLGFAGVLYGVTPVVGILLAVTAALVVIAVTVRAVGQIPLGPEPKILREG
jgi:hypothetical protein